MAISNGSAETARMSRRGMARTDIDSDLDVESTHADFAGKTHMASMASTYATHGDLGLNQPLGGHGRVGDLKRNGK